jgi:type I restriction enzyme M protein
MAELSAGGDWAKAAAPRPTIEDKERKLNETPDLELGTGRKKTKYKMDLVPPSLIVARYFAEEQARVDEVNAELEAATTAVTQHAEEHGTDEGVLADATNDKGAYTKQLVNAVIKAAKLAHDEETLDVARDALALIDAEASLKRIAKRDQAALDEMTLRKYGDLTGDEVKSIVLDDKWHAAIATKIDGEVNALTLTLVARVQQLGERYAETVGDLDANLEELEAKVAGHLAAMGVES